MNDIKKRKNIIFLLIFVIIAGLTIYKALFSSHITFYDESQYLVYSLQICNGSKLLIDDWNAAQLSGLITLPLVFLYKIIVGGTDGIILFSRMMYLTVKLAITCGIIFVYKKRNEKGPEYLLSLAVIFFIISPFNIDTFSYNSIVLLSLNILLIIMDLYDAKVSHIYIYIYIYAFITGLLVSIISICHPFCALGFFLVGLYLFGSRRIRNLKEESCISGTVMLAFGSGILAIGIYALGIIFNGSNLIELVLNLRYILSNPGHDVINGGVIYSFVTKIINCINEFRSTFPLETAIGLIIVVLAIVKKDNKQLIVSLDFVYTILSMAHILIKYGCRFGNNYIFAPFVFSTFVLVILDNERKYRYMYAISILCWLGVYIGSNTGVLTVWACHSLVVLFWLIIKKYDFQNKKKAYCSAAIIVLLLLMFTHFAINWNEWTNIEVSKNVVDVGPLKGTFLSDELYEDYSDCITDIDKVAEITDGRIVITGCCPLTYIRMDRSMGGTFYSEEYERLDEYLSLHDEGEFQIIFFPRGVWDTDNRKLTDEERNLLDKWMQGDYVVIEKGIGCFAVDEACLVQ